MVDARHHAKGKEKVRPSKVGQSMLEMMALTKFPDCEGIS